MFLPLVFGERNEMSIFLVHVAVPIVVAMLASLVIAQTLMPMLAARMSPPPPIAAGSWFGRLQDRYARRSTGRCRTARPWALITLLIVVSPVPLFVLKLAKVDPFPQEASRVLMLNYHIEGSHPMARVEQAVRRVEAYMAANQERFDVETYYSVWLNDEAHTRLYLRPKDEAKVGAAEVMERVHGGHAGDHHRQAELCVRRHGSSATSFSLQLRANRPSSWRTFHARWRTGSSSVEGLEAVRSEAGTGEQEVQVIVNRDRASQLGLTTQDVAMTVAGAMRGDRLPELRTTERELTMRLAFRESDRQSVEDLARVPRHAAGRLAHRARRGRRFRREAERPRNPAPQPADDRRDQRQHGQGTTMDEARKRVEPIMEAYPLPPGYSWKFGRGLEENDKAMQTMAQNMLLAVVLIFLVMASLFESALYPLSIITSIVFAIVGSIWFLALTGTTITMMAMIGFMVLIGVVVNIGIVLIAHVIDLRAAGLPRHEAILQAGRDRLRPIMMTTLTTLLGMMPLAIGDAQVGGGGEGPGVLPDGARRHRRPRVLVGRFAADRADVLRLVR